VFDYSFAPHPGTWEVVADDMRARSAPLKAIQIDGFKSGSGKEVAPQGSPLPASQCSFIGLEPAGLVLSTVKRSEYGACLVVRFYNPTDTSVEAVVTCFREILKVEPANLAEEPLKAAPIRQVQPKKITVPVQAEQIVTLRMQLAKA
jgi:alpha-mannosidase